MNHRLTVIAAACSFLISFAAAEADDVTPRSVHFEAGKSPAKGADECGIVLRMSNAPSPEIVIVRLSLGHTVGTNDTLLFAVVDVADGIFKDGQLADYRIVPLSSAAMSSNAFTTAGQFTPSVEGDGSVYLTSPDKGRQTDLMNAFLFYPMKVTFVRGNPEVTKTYVVPSPPPPEVVNEFNQCGINMLSTK